MAVISLLLVVSINLIIGYKDILTRRIQIDKSNRELYAVIQELKYNYTIEEILEKSKNYKINIKKNDEFLEKLIETKLFEMPLGEDIVITIDNVKEDCLNMSVKIKDKIRSANYEVKESFIKSRWMNEK